MASLSERTAILKSALDKNLSGLRLSPYGKLKERASYLLRNAYDGNVPDEQASATVDAALRQFIYDMKIGQWEKVMKLAENKMGGEMLLTSNLLPLLNDEIQLVYDRKRAIEQGYAPEVSGIKDDLLPLVDVKSAPELYWKAKFSFVTDHDGVPTAKMNSTVNIRDNPLLIKAIEEIRDGYFKHGNDLRQMDHGRFFDSLIHREQNRRFRNERNRLERQVIIYNHDSLIRLTEKDYGFSPERKSEILAEAPHTDPASGQPLSENDAKMLLGIIIGRSMDAYEEAFEYRPNIPASFNKAAALKELGQMIESGRRGTATRS